MGKIEKQKQTDLLLLSDEFRELPDNIIPFERYLPKFTIPVSAGLGEFLDGDLCDVTVSEKVLSLFVQNSS